MPYVQAGSSHQVSNHYIIMMSSSHHCSPKVLSPLVLHAQIETRAEREGVSIDEAKVILY